MSNHVTHRTIILHHKQQAVAREKKASRAENRRYSFEVNRASIKARVEADREYLAVGALVFLIGLILVVFGLIYVIGIIRYG